MDGLRILIDTNVFIPLEGEGEEEPTESLAADLVRFAQQHGCTVLVHPACVEDLRRDRDKKRLRRSLQKLRKYPLLQSPPQADGGFIAAVQIGEPTPQDASCCRAVT